MYLIALDGAENISLAQNIGCGIWTFFSSECRQKQLALNLSGRAGNCLHVYVSVPALELVPDPTGSLAMVP